MADGLSGTTKQDEDKYRKWTRMKTTGKNSECFLKQEAVINRGGNCQDAMLRALKPDV